MSSASLTDRTTLIDRNIENPLNGRPRRFPVHVVSLNGEVGEVILSPYTENVRDGPRPVIDLISLQLVCVFELYSLLKNFASRNRHSTVLNCALN